MRPEWPSAGEPYTRGSRELSLEPEEVHLWTFDLDALSLAGAVSADALSEEERRRAARMHRREDAERKLASRCTLRAILGHYLGIPASEVEFGYGEQGKPFLTRPLRGGGRLEFNLSHAGPVALVAVARGIPVGVDVERVRPFPEFESVARRFFSESECRTLLNLPEAERTEAFYRIWTRKEAFVKALGEGLTHPLESFDVSTEPDRALLLRTSNGDGGPRRWTLAHLVPAPGFVGAVSARFRPLSLRSWQWVPSPLWHSRNDFSGPGKPA